MSQSKQETCKKNDPVQAKKMFEDDIGEDFLSSWKPSAVKNDTTLDFGNEAPPKAKKTSFSLDKFDVDFDFDGGFSKLSTFDVDMSDLDFRSPPSKTQKSKEKIQENSQEKKEGFQFKFDFNGLDGFDLDCTLLKGKEEKKNHVKEKTSMPSSEGSEGISKSKGKEILGKEEKENSAQEKESMPSNENVSISKSKVISKNVNNNSESHDSGAVPQRSSVAYSKFNLSEFSTEVADSEHGGPSKSSSQSPCTSVSQDLGSKQCRKTTPEKRSIMEDSLFGNLLRTGDSNAVKQKSRFTESKYFDKVAVSKSKNKLISQNVDDNSESSDSGTVLKQLTLAHSKSKHSEFSMEQVDFQHDIPPKSLAKSPLTNGFQNGETNLCKQPSADKHGLIAGTFFGNLLQTGDTINVKQTSNPTESKYSDKVAVSKSKSKLTSQNIDDNLESCDDGTVPKQPTVPNSKSTLSELCIEDIDSQHGVPPKSLAQSPCTSGSQDAGIEQCKQITADKQGDIVDTCFGNTLKAGDSNTLKQKSTLTQSRYSDKMGSSPTLSSYSGSSDKSLSHIVSPSKGTRATKGLEGDEDQSLAQTAARHKGMADYDSTSKNSNPGKIERSKCTPDNYTSANICAVDCSDMKLLSRKLDTAAQKDINDNTRSQVNQCQNQEGFGEYKSTLPRTPFSVMQREITSQKNVTPKSITDQTRKQELNVITDESASEKPSDEKRCLSGDANINGPPVPMKKIQVHCSKPSSVSTQKLSRHSDINPVLQQKEGQHDGIRNRHQDNVLLGSNKIHQTTSLAKDGHKVALDRNYSAAESKTHHGPQKSLLSGVAKTNETKIRVGKDPLWESSKLIDSGKKLASVMIPRKHSQNPPTLQVSRPQSANGKPKTLLKQTSERLSSSKPTISISANISLSKKIFPLTEQKITTLSPMPPLKRKPMELIAEASSMNPLKRISGSLSVTEKKKSRNCSPSLEGIATDQTYGEIPRGSLSESLSGELSEDKSCQKPTKSFVQEEVMETDRQVAFSSSIDQTDQHLNRHSPNQEDTRDSADISMLEGDDNVEKADNCSRDLEDMCNMLKRKHEEAKDLLVRAIVTNNLLLMLNHPLHEEKIQTIKRYVTSTFPEECTR